MGRLSRFPIAEWRKRYGLEVFVETGTWKGDGLLCALRAGFPVAFSIELHPEQAETARKRIRQHFPEDSPRAWAVIEGDSGRMIPKLLPNLSQPLGAHHAPPVLWWLDAHLPERYTGTGQGAQTPLEQELQAIVHSRRDHARDVFILDDMRLYQRGGWANGDFDGELAGNLADLDRLMNPTHRPGIVPNDEGYLVCIPRDTSAAG